MRRCVFEARSGAALRVVWKYILFEHNSAPQQLLRAQQLAAETGVHELVFVFSRNGPFARGVTEPEHVPSAGLGVPIRFTVSGASVPSLRHAVTMASARLDRKDPARAADLLRHVAGSLARHFPPPDALPPPYAALLENAARQAERLPPPLRAALAADLCRLEPPTPDP